MSSEKPLIHAFMPENYDRTRCGLDCYRGCDVEVDNECVNCQECQSGLFHDLSERTKNLEKLVVSLKGSIDELLRRLSGSRGSESTYDDESY